MYLGKRFDLAYRYGYANLWKELLNALHEVAHKKQLLQRNVFGRYDVPHSNLVTHPKIGTPQQSYDIYRFPVCGGGATKTSEHKTPNPEKSTGGRASLGSDFKLQHMETYLKTNFKRIFLKNN